MRPLLLKTIPYMELITKEQHSKLIENGKRSIQLWDETERFDPHPVVKLFTPDGACTWLLTELDPDNPNIAFGLCDLGGGFPELGTVAIDELKALRGSLGLPIERDLFFTADKSLSAYAEDARQASGINA